MGQREIVGLAQAKLAVGLARCEDSIAELYETYGRALPHMTNFWIRLSEEERAHARLLMAAHKLLESGNLFLNTSQFDSAALKMLEDYIARERTAASQPPISDTQAIGAALSIEVALGEVQLREAEPSGVPELEGLVRGVSTHTRRHVEAIGSQLAHARPNPSVKTAHPRKGARVAPEEGSVDYWQAQRDR
jgi:hypothetical protein